MVGLIANLIFTKLNKNCSNKGSINEYDNKFDYASYFILEP